MKLFTGVYFRTLKRTLSSMASSERKLIAVCQMSANNNKDQNYETCKKLIESAKQKQAQVFLFHNVRKLASTPVK